MLLAAVSAAAPEPSCATWRMPQGAVLDRFRLSERTLYVGHDARGAGVLMQCHGCSCLLGIMQASILELAALALLNRYSVVLRQGWAQHVAVAVCRLGCSEAMSGYHGIMV